MIGFPFLSSMSLLVNTSLIVRTGSWGLMDSYPLCVYPCGNLLVIKVWLNVLKVGDKAMKNTMKQKKIILSALR